MPRSLIVLPALMLLLTSVSAAPVPKEKPKAGIYYPTQVGARWVVKTNGGEAAFVVTAVERKGGSLLVKVEHEIEGRTVPSQIMEVSDKGVFRLEVGGLVRDPPECLLKLPHRPGDKWVFRSGAQEEVFTAVGTESITVPAGTFTAIRVERQFTNKLRHTYWFAPKVGLIRVCSNGGLEHVLKSSTAGEDRPMP